MEPYPATTPSEMPPSTKAVERNAIGALVGSASAVVLYLVFLGWHAMREPHTCTGPYENQQVIGLALALVAVVVVCALWRGEWGAAGAESVTITALFIVDALTVVDPCNVGANLWPVGAAFLFIGAILGLGLVAALTSLARPLFWGSKKR